jgi:dolichol-phosphate mannosyltransferase
LEKAHSCVIIIPAYNEESTIEQVVLGAKRYADVCVIDDGSSDATPEILKKISDIQVISHEKNTHIPGCVRDGMRYAVEHGYSYAITMDAGLSHNPDELPLFMNQESAALLIGYRKKKIHTPVTRRVLSRIGNIIYNISLDFPKSMFHRYYRDISSGFRRYSSEAMQLLLSRNTASRSFDIMVESVYFIYTHNLRIAEVPISYRYSSSSLNLNVIKDCIRMCFKILLGYKFGK